MSVFYNLKLENVENVDVKPADFYSICDQEIITDQTQYQVGVNRYKIPCGDVDLFRIYPNRYQIAFCYSAGSPKTAFRGKRQLVDLFSANGCDPHTEVDSHIITNTNIGVKNPDRYNVIQSSHHFCKVLNRSLAHSLYNTVINTNPADASGADNVAVIFTPADCALTIKTNTTPNYAYFDIDFAGVESGDPVKLWETTVQNTYDATLVDMKFKVNPHQLTPLFSRTEMFKENAETADMIFNDIQFSVDVTNQIASGDVGAIAFSIPLFSNVGKNITFGEFFDLFPNGIEYRMASKLGAFDDKYSVIERNVGGTTPKVIHCDNGVDLENLMGANVRNWKFTVNCRYVGEYVVAAGEPRFRLPAHISDETRSGMTFELTTSSDKFFQSGYRTYNDAYGSIEGIPLFHFDDVTERIYLNIQRDYLYGRGFGIYVNNGLKNLLNFDVGNPQVNFDNIKSHRAMSSYFAPSKDPSNESGTAITFDNSNSGNFLRLDDRDQVEDKTDGSNVYVKIYEPVTSIWKRNFLYGIAILSPSLAIAGEFIGDGKEKRKILTDFVTDPSINFRDYVIFYNEGNIRFHPLRSQTALREIIVGVYYVDMNNNLTKINIPQGQCCSMKLEFRPNEQINNY